MMNRIAVWILMGLALIGVWIGIIYFVVKIAKYAWYG